VSRRGARSGERRGEPIAAGGVALIHADFEGGAMAWKTSAREHLGPGSILGFLVVLMLVILGFMAIFWTVV
jgi:hypothetical protein